jgi:hypothetical protein
MKGYGLTDERGNVLFRDDSEKGLFYGMRKTFAPYVLGVSALAGACGGPTGPDPTPSGTPTPPGRVTVSGAITGRMSGESINGCEITYTGKNGQGIKKAVSVNGSYEMTDMPTGVYEVKVENCGNLTHTNQNFNLAGSNAPFSVLRWNSQGEGAVYDQKFDAFFNAFARNEGNLSTQRGVDKWDVNRSPPREFYISLTPPSEFYRNWNPEAAEEFRGLLQEVVSESFSDMYGGKVNSVAINSGPSVGLYKPSTVVFAIRPDITQVNDVHRTNGFIDGSVVSLFTERFNNPNNYRDSFKRRETKGVLAHELGHVAGAFHAYNSGYNDSIMGPGRFENITALSNEDRLAFRIIYHDDTHPGNLPPDTNPR